MRLEVLSSNAHAKRAWLLPLCVLVGAAFFLSACGSGGDEQAEEDAPVPAVEVLQARYGALPLREQLSGTVRATGQVQVYPERSGRLVAVTAQDGDFVKKGEVLARVSARSSQAQLSQAQASLQSARAQAQEAQANLEELQSQFARTQKLADKGMVSQQQLETQRAQVQRAKASYQQTKAQVQQARSQIDERAEAVGQTVVRAPISGRVGQRNAEVGMQAGGQTPLFTIGDLSEVKVQVPVTQDMIGRIREGQTARITAGGLRGDSIITAQVSRISPFLESGTYSAEAEIDVNNESDRLRPGMFVNVDVSYGESRKATLIPASALYKNPNTGARGVYVASSLGDELRATPSSSESEQAPLVGPVPMQFRPVQVVAEGGQVAGVRGIDPGTWVVVVGQHLLGNGRGAEEGPPQARARPTRWARIVDLQRLQQQDLLREFMDEQQRDALPSPKAADSSSVASPWRADSTTAMAS